MTPSLSICLFSSFYPPVYSGSAIHCADLARNLVKRGCRVTVITSRVSPESPEFEIVEGIVIHRLPCLMLPKLEIALNFPWLNLSFFPHNMRRVLEILYEHPPDVLHLHNHMFDSALLAVFAARHLNIPLALSVHTIIKHSRPLYDFFLHLADLYLLKYWVVQQAQIVICQDATVEAYIGKTFDHKHVALIPYGISPLREPNPENVEALRERYGLNDYPIILSLGHLHETRNRKELIGILPELLNIFPGLKLLIVGYVGTDSARKLAERLGVEKNVIFAGAIPHEDIPDFLALADIEAHWFDLTHPHRTPGIAGQEVMLAGGVLVTNAHEDVYGAGVFRDGENVILIDPSDPHALFESMVNILSDAKKRHAIGANSKRTARECFSWDAVYGRMTEAYFSIKN